MYGEATASTIEKYHFILSSQMVRIFRSWNNCNDSIFVIIIRYLFIVLIYHLQILKKNNGFWSINANRFFSTLGLPRIRHKIKAKRGK